MLRALIVVFAEDKRDRLHSLLLPFHDCNAFALSLACYAVIDISLARSEIEKADLKNSRRKLILF